MESTARKFTQVALTLICAVFMATGFTSCGLREDPLVRPPKPAVDARLLVVCDVRLSPLPAGEIDVTSFYVSYAEAIDKLHTCACRHIEARNVLCSLTEPGCAAAPSCVSAAKP